jgi:Mg-dependent DNase
MSTNDHQVPSNQDDCLSSSGERLFMNALPRYPLAFDAHNHIQLSMPGGIPPLSENEMYVPPQCKSDPCSNEVFDLGKNILNSFTDDHLVKEEEISNGDEPNRKASRSENFFKFPKVGGLAIMSTQPRDFPIVQQLRNAINLISMQQTTAEGTKHTQHVQIAVPCYGVHPWFLSQANQDFSAMPSISLLGSEKDASPSWIPYLKEKLESDPQSHLGEIGLDGARYEIDPATNQKVLVSSMDDQIHAFEAQMHLAADLKKSVSIHAVQCWGPLMDSIRRIKTSRLKMKKEQRSLDKNKANDVLILPPKIYFHAFGGKAAVVDQLDAICKDKSMESFACETFYGFAPVINFRFPKTASVMHRVGIDRLILETDLEDYRGVREDVWTNAEFTARVLNLDVNEVLQRTFDNACRLYNISSTSVE